MGDKGREDPRKSGHAIQQEKTRRGTMRDTGRQDPREGGHTIQHQGGHLKKVLRTPNSTLLGEQEGRRGETRGDKTLGKGDIQQRETKRGTIGDKGRQKGRQGETRPSGRRTHHPTKGNNNWHNGRQDPREGRHTIQHQGGHLKKALRTPNSTLLGE